MALVAVTFNDVVNITPGDDEEYSRVLVALGINSGVNSWPRNFFDDCYVPGAAIKSLYDKDTNGRLRELLLSHPGLGEERAREAVHAVVTTVKDNPARSDLHSLPYGVLANPALTRDMVSEVVQVAELLPSHAVNEFLKSVQQTEDDVMALWECQSRRYPFVEQSQCDFVDIATRCGLAPHSLVEQWLGNADYAPYAAAHATNVCEDDVLAVAGKPGCSYALRNRILSHGALWREAKRRRGAWTDLAHLFANEGAPPALLEYGARDEEYQWVWKSIASNPAATRAAFETLLFTGSNDKKRLLLEAGRNRCFPPGLVWDVYRVFGAGSALGFRNAPPALVRDLAGFYADGRLSSGYSTGMNVLFHRNCPADVRSHLAWDDRALWPLVADDAYRGRHEKKAAKSGGDGVDFSSLYPLCG